MYTHLTEITAPHLFVEYLHCLGIRIPRLRENWEFKDKDRIMARIQMGHEGQPRFFISAAHIGRKV